MSGGVMTVRAATKDRFYTAVGVAIEHAREAAKLTQRELALRAGVTPAQVSRAELGETCTLLALALIAEALDTTLDALVPTEATKAAAT